LTEKYNYETLRLYYALGTPTLVLYNIGTRTSLVIISMDPACTDVRCLFHDLSPFVAIHRRMLGFLNVSSAPLHYVIYPLPVHPASLVAAVHLAEDFLLIIGHLTLCIVDVCSLQQQSIPVQLDCNNKFSNMHQQKTLTLNPNLKVENYRIPTRTVSVNYILAHIWAIQF